MVFIHLVRAGIFLSLVNRSFYLSVLGTFGYHNWLLRGIIIVTVFLLFLLIAVPGLRDFFRFFCGEPAPVPGSAGRKLPFRDLV